MPRTVDPKRTRKALRAVRKLRESVPEQELSDWERSFLGEVDQRLERFGSAFADFSKGAPDEALSRLQAVKLREIRAKTNSERREERRRFAEPKPEIEPDSEGNPAGAPPPKGWTRRSPLRAKRPPKLQPG